MTFPGGIGKRLFLGLEFSTNCSLLCACSSLFSAFGLCCILVYCGDLWMVAVVATVAGALRDGLSRSWLDGSCMLLCLVL
jgi:hypothetical protein